MFKRANGFGFMAASALAAMALMGCGEDLARPSEIVSLRVLGVRADNPFSRPGSHPNLEMLMVDGAPESVSPEGVRREVQVVWLEGCVNPPGDLYYACYPALHAVTGALTDDDLRLQRVPPGLPAGFGLQYRATQPADIIASRPVAASVVHPYGLSYAFFAACGGELRKLAGADPMTEFPLGCFRPGTDELLGTADFLYGYFPMYAYDDIKNNNPSLSGVAFGGKVFEGETCSVDADCPPNEACGGEGACIPVVDSCSAEEPDDCPELALRPLVDPGSIEPAVTAKVPLDAAPGENVWVSYYSTAGSWKADGIVIHDPSQGYRDDYDGQWRASGVGPGVVRLFAVVRDNRDGVSWVWQDVKVR